MNGVFVMSISVCMIIKNEEKRLINFFENMRDEVDEIIVVDTGSEDNSIKICSDYANKVISYDHFYSFSEARNKSLEYATKDWILILDADEIILKDDMQKLKYSLDNSKYLAHRLPRYNYIGGGMWSFFDMVKVFRNNIGVKFTRDIHETIKKSLPNEIFPVMPSYIHHFIGESNLDKNKLYMKMSSEYNQKNQNDPVSYTFLGIEYFALGMYSEALSQIEKAKIINPEASAPYYFAGFMHYKMGEYELAMSCFEKLYQISKHQKNEEHFFDEACLGIAMCKYALNEYEIALQYCKDAIQFDSTPAHSYINVGRCYQALGYYEKALDSYEQALKMNPFLKDPSIYFPESTRKTSIYSFDNIFVQPFKGINFYIKNCQDSLNHL